MGCPKDLCEDLTQEMYIKIDAYLKKTDNNIMYEDDINIYFVYLTLRSLFTDYVRKNNKIKKVEINESILEKKVDENYADKIQIDVVKDLQKITIEEWYHDHLYLDLLDKEDFTEVEYTKEELEKYYLRRIFKEIFYDEVQISQLSKDTNITYWSLRNTINIIKKQIRKKYETRKPVRNDF